MVATFSWVEYNTNATDTGVPTNLNLGSANARNLAPSLYPITAGTYSYSKWVRGVWSGSFTRIDNLQFWMSASGSGYVTGETLKVSATTGTYSGTSTYAVPVQTADGKANKAMPIAAPGTANIGIGGSLSGSITTATPPNNAGDFIVVQASIKSTASAGPVQQKTFTLQYDEV
jgi:hypothetical protein